MKYIRIFEEFSEKYQKISIDEFDELIYDEDRRCSFSDNEIDIIKNMMIHYDPNLFDLFDNKSHILARLNIKGMISKNLFVDFYKLKDEYYILQIPGLNIQYKCDQFDGLIDPLSDIINKLNDLNFRF